MITVGDKIEVESFDERMDKIHSAHGGQKYIAKGVYKKKNILFVLNQPDYYRTGKGKKSSFYGRIVGDNLVTNDGDIFYAQAGALTTPSPNFADTNGRMELANAAQTIAKGDTYGNVASPVTTSRKAIDATYPKVNDTDPDNTGAGVNVVTWRTSWTKADFNATGIVGGCIHDAGSTPISGSKLLTHFSVASFDKTVNDSLKGFINHQMLGV